MQPILHFVYLPYFTVFSNGISLSHESAAINVCYDWHCRIAMKLSGNCIFYAQLSVYNMRSNFYLTPLNLNYKLAVVSKTMITLWFATPCCWSW